MCPCMGGMQDEHARSTGIVEAMMRTVAGEHDAERTGAPVIAEETVRGDESRMSSRVRRSQRKRTGGAVEIDRATASVLMKVLFGAGREIVEEQQLRQHTWNLFHWARVGSLDISMRSVAALLLKAKRAQGQGSHWIEEMERARDTETGMTAGSAVREVGGTMGSVRSDGSDCGWHSIQACTPRIWRVPFRCPCRRMGAHLAR